MKKIQSFSLLFNIQGIIITSKERFFILGNLSKRNVTISTTTHEPTRSEHISQKPTLNSDSNRWEYYKPRYVDRNDVAYHLTLLLLWGAHMNML
jgi:hypothetical protein